MTLWCLQLLLLNLLRKWPLTMLLVMLKNYTAIYYKKENERNLMEQEKTLNFMFESVVKYCKVFHETKIYEESPKELKFDKTYIQSLE